MSFFVVLGLGRFGTSLAIALKDLGHEVLAVDENQNVVNSIKDEVKDAIVADIREKETIAELGAKDADAVIVAVGSLESSILCTLNLIDLKVKKIYAKVKSKEHAKVLKSLGLDEQNLIFPEKDSANKLAESLSTKNIMDIIPIEEDYRIAIFAMPNSFIGKSLKGLDLRKKYQVQVIGIKDTLTGKLDLVPSAEIILKESDELMIIGKEENIKKFSNIK